MTYRFGCDDDDDLLSSAWGILASFFPTRCFCFWYFASMSVSTGARSISDMSNNVFMLWMIRWWSKGEGDVDEEEEEEEEEEDDM